MGTRGRLVGGRYRLDSVIGTGGMGTVWRAFDNRLARWVAVKEIRFDHLASAEEREELRQRAMTEALSAGRLFHPNIVAVYDAVEDGGQPWVVMRLVEGQSLRRQVHDSGPLAPVAAARLALGLLSALEAAHAAGVIHRDVKPSNVLMQADGRPLLSDFSIASVTEIGAAAADLAAAGITTVPIAHPAIRGTAVMGSPGYVAPERLYGAPGGAPADLFGLGATLFFAVEGYAPFARGDAMACLVATVCEPHPKPRRAGPLTAVINGLLAKDEADRLDGAEARALLRAALRPEERRASPPSMIKASLKLLERREGRLDHGSAAPAGAGTAKPGAARVGRRARVALATSAAAVLLPLAAALANAGSGPLSNAEGPGGGAPQRRPAPPGVPSIVSPDDALALALPGMAYPPGTSNPPPTQGMAAWSSGPTTGAPGDGGDNGGDGESTGGPSGGGGGVPPTTTTAPPPPAEVTGVSVSVSVGGDCTWSATATATVSGATTVTYRVTRSDTGGGSQHTASASAAGSIALDVPSGVPHGAGPVSVQVDVLSPNAVSDSDGAELPAACSATESPTPTPSTTRTVAEEQSTAPTTGSETETSATPATGG